MPWKLLHCGCCFGGTARRPRHTFCHRGRRGRRIPIRPRSAAACRPIWRRLPRRTRRRGRPGDRPCRRYCSWGLPDAANWRRASISTIGQTSRRSTGWSGGVNTTDRRDEVLVLRLRRPRGAVPHDVVKRRRLLGRRDVAGRFDELAELGVGHVRLVNPDIRRRGRGGPGVPPAKRPARHFPS